MPNNYRTIVDKKDSTRLFVEFAEYKIDYSKTLDNGVNGSWVLAKNWAANIPAVYASTYKFGQAVTFPNGHTYVRRQINGATYELAELVEGGTARLSGIMLGRYGFLGEHGSKIEIENLRN